VFTLSAAASSAACDEHGRTKAQAAPCGAHGAASCAIRVQGADVARADMARARESCGNAGGQLLHALAGRHAPNELSRHAGPMCADTVLRRVMLRAKAVAMRRTRQVPAKTPKPYLRMYV
jgi:hypothetical protein